MKKGKISKTLLALFITMGALFISMFGTSMVQTNAYTVDETTYTLTLKDLGDKMRDNMADNGRTVKILFTEDTTYQFCFTTYIPKNATKNTPAPVVIGAHGYNNSKEMQLSNITELSRRGFVVIVPDLAGHGRSDIEIDTNTGGTQGMLAAVQYAMTMSCVDPMRIGITGHSAGNLMCSNTIKLVNTADATYRISAFFCPAGTIAALFTMSQPDLIFGVAAGKYDELDTYYFKTFDFLKQPSAVMMVKMVYPAFSGIEVPEGQWFTAAGPVATPANGASLGVSSAIVLYNPPITHVGGTFSTIATQYTVDFFYTAFGVPTGATYLSGGYQIWIIGVVFQLIGLLAFFVSIFVVGASLLKTKSFADLNGFARPQKELPSIKSWKEWVPIVVTFVPLILFPFFMYFTCYNQGTALFNTSVYSMPNINGIAWFTLVCGLFSLLMLFVNMLAKKLCHLKDGTVVSNSWAPAKMESLKKFLKTLLFSAIVVALIYIPCLIAYYGFDMNFGIAVYNVGIPRYQWLPTILFRYLPMWLIFMVPNAILNAGFRYKEIPEWASTAFCAVANLLPIVLLIWINYTVLTTTGQTYYTFGDPTIMVWNLLPPMILAAIAGRYYYKKTGNVWAGAMITATVMTIMACTITRHTSDTMFTY